MKKWLKWSLVSLGILVGLTIIFYIVILIISFVNPISCHNNRFMSNFCGGEAKTSCLKKSPGCEDFNDYKNAKGMFITCLAQEGRDSLNLDVDGNYVPCEELMEIDCSEEYSCEDYSFQNEPSYIYDYCLDQGNVLTGLDNDGNGIVCEDLRKIEEVLGRT